MDSNLLTADELAEKLKVQKNMALPANTQKRARHHPPTARREVRPLSSR